MIPRLCTKGCALRRNVNTKILGSRRNVLYSFFNQKQQRHESSSQSSKGILGQKSSVLHRSLAWTGLIGGTLIIGLLFVPGRKFANNYSIFNCSTNY
jgi:hypothetical protein